MMLKLEMNTLKYLCLFFHYFSFKQFIPFRRNFFIVTLTLLSLGDEVWSLSKMLSLLEKKWYSEVVCEFSDEDIMVSHTCTLFS